MSDSVTDTHALIWNLRQSPRLSPVARSVFKQADAGAHIIFVPSIVLVEMIYLAEKLRIDAGLVSQAFALVAGAVPQSRSV